MLNEVENGVADITIYNRIDFIDWINERPLSPPGLVNMISSPACVFHKVEPGNAFFVIATTVSGHIGCFDMVRTIRYNSFGSNQNN